MTKNILILCIFTGLLFTLFPSVNTSTETQKQNPVPHFLLPSQNYHLIFIVAEKTKRQASISSSNNFLLNDPAGYNRHPIVVIHKYFTAETLPSYIFNLLYTQATSSCL